MEGITPDQLVKLVFVLILGSFMLVLLAGMTNRVVIFADRSDFFWSISVVVIPLVCVILVWFLAPSEIPEGYNLFVDNAIGLTLTVIGVTTTSFSVYKVFLYSIHANGLALGLVIAVFKLVASGIAVWLILGLVLGKPEENKDQMVGYVKKVVLAGVFGWVLFKLINGPAVEQRRERLLRNT